MIAPLLTLTLALCAPVSAAQSAPVPVAMPPDEIAPARRAELEVMAADWVSAKSRAYRVMAVFTEGAVRYGYSRADVNKTMKQVRDLMNDVENTQYTASEIAREQIRAAYPPSPERLARENAAEMTFQLRALTVYSNMLPRILDEWIQDPQGKPIGRNYAGREWALPFTLDEGAGASRWHAMRAGFTIAEYHEIENRAADSLGIARPGKFQPEKP